jgi:iron complex outermembrane receptor protein
MLCFRRASRAILMAGSALMAPQVGARNALSSDAVPAAGTPATDVDTAVGQGASLQTVKGGDGSIIVTAKHYVPVGSITATKSDIPLIQTPQSVSVITRDQIDLLSFVDLQQAVRYTAGVGGENYGSDPRYDFITVRGFTPRQFIDGLAVPSTTTFDSTGVDLYLFQSVDILKGPSSVLYGSAPPGGILNETMRRPSDTTSGEFVVKGGTDDFKELAGTITGPATSFLDVRMTALVRDTATDQDHTRDKRIAVAPSATLKLGLDTSLTLLAYYQYDQDRGGAGGFVPAYGSLYANPNGKISRSTNLDDPADEFNRTQYGVGYEFDQRFGNAIKFVSNTKYSHYHEDTPIGVYNSGGFTNTTDPSLPSYYNTILQSNYTFGEKVSSFATDNRLDIKADIGPIKHNILVGVDYRNVRDDANYGFDYGSRLLDVFDPVYTPVPGPYPESVRYNQQKLQQTGIYGQDQLNYDRFFLTLSGRYDWVKAESALAYGAASSPPVYTGQKEHKFTYRAGLSYVTDAGIAPYVSYATSFEPQLGVNSATNTALKPTSVKQWEGGVKYDARGLPRDFKLFATAAGFDIKESNFVSEQVGQTAIGTSLQGGTVEVYGAEFELVARIHEQLSINLAYSYNRSKVLSSVAEPLDVGYPLPVAPKNKATAFVDYTFSKGTLAGFGVGGGVRYTSATTGALPGLSATPVIYGNSSTLFDADIHYDLPGWRFSVNGSNLADKRYVARCASLSECYFGAARQVLGTITKKF